MDINLFKAIGTGISALICGFCLHKTKGKSGIGWFAFSLIIIWGS